jgi:hypothetical protein
VYLLTGECHGTAAYKAQTTSIYDVIGHRLIFFLPRVWTQSAICHRHETPLRLLFQTSLEKNRNSIATFQSGHLTEQSKTMDDLGCFDLKIFRNCPIRIGIRS